MFQVTGTLSDGEPGAMTFSQEWRTTCAGTRKSVWHQRGTSDSTNGLHREYVSGESFDAIVTNWMPVDWKAYQITRAIDDPQHAEERRADHWMAHELPMGDGSVLHERVGGGDWGCDE